MWFRCIISCRRLKCEHVAGSIFHPKIAVTQYHLQNDSSKISLQSSLILSENLENNTKGWILLGCFGVLTLTGGVSLLKHLLRIGHADARSNLKIEKRDDLPSYRMEEVRKHGKNAETIWVTYQGVCPFSLIYFNFHFNFH
ncbi:unnamed protein product [Onchocerca flexuosa]|uniref:SURF1-like protein n=1 Tax=Onchocerca flexuosa TaxID=387005 RepID=A0A183HMJ4_9BILA|nr:unnamed protein product [Onchocerca flexuosa]